MNEMLQRAVEAIKDSSDNSPEGIARTVISAMTIPTKEMLAEMQGWHSMETAWRVGIATALKETPVRVALGPNPSRPKEILK
jgi:hypothetical protein